MTRLDEKKTKLNHHHNRNNSITAPSCLSFTRIDFTNTLFSLRVNHPPSPLTFKCQQRKWKSFSFSSLSSSSASIQKKTKKIFRGGASRGRTRLHRTITLPWYVPCSRACGRFYHYSWLHSRAQSPRCSRGGMTLNVLYGDGGLRRLSSSW